MAHRREFRSYPGLPKPALVVIGPKSEDINNDELRPLYELWESYRRDDSPFPDESILSDEAIKPYARHMILLKMIVDDGEIDYLYLRFGEEITKAYGRDMTGRKTSEFPSSVSAFFREVYDEVVMGNMPAYTEHAPPIGVSVEAWHRLVLPLGDTESMWLLVIIPSLSGYHPHPLYVVCTHFPE